MAMVPRVDDTPDPETLRRRVEAIQSGVRGIRGTIKGELAEQVRFQEQLLSQVYRPIVQYIQQLVDHNQSQLDPIVDLIVTSAQTGVNSNQALLDTVTTALPEQPPILPSDPPSPLCPPGTVGSFGVCVPAQPPPTPCPPGYHPDPNDPSGGCIPDVLPPVPPEQPPVPPEAPPQNGGPSDTGLGCGKIKEVPQDSNCCAILGKLLDDPAELWGPPDGLPPVPPANGGKNGTPIGGCPAFQNIEVSPGVYAGCHFDPKTGRRMPDSDPRCPAVSPFCKTNGSNNGHITTNNASLSHTHHVYINAIPRNPIGQRLAGPAPLRSILSVAVPLLPGGMVPRFFESDGPPPEPGAQCPPDDSCPKQDDGTEPEPEPDPCAEYELPGLDEFKPDEEAVCTTVDVYIAAFDKLGQTLLSDFITSTQKILDLKALIKEIKDIPVIGSLFSGVLDRADKTFDLLQCITLAVNKVGAMNFHIRATTLVGLWFVKAFITAFEEIYLGLEFPVVAMDKISIEMRQLKQIIEYLIDYVGPLDIPVTGETRKLWLNNEITETHAKCLHEMRGMTWRFGRAIAHAERERPGTLELVDLWRRGVLRDQEFTDALRAIGWIDAVDIQRLQELAFEAPTPADLLGFSRREVFRVDKLGVEEMAREFEGEIGLRNLFRAGGIDKILVAFDAPENAEIPHVWSPIGQGMAEFDRPLAHWLEHYTEISQGQGAEGLHRLRPNRVRRFRSFVPGKTPEDMAKLVPFADFEFDANRGGTWIIPKPWTSYEQAKLLRQLEYNPVERGLLEAISYRVITRVDVRRIYAASGFGTPVGLRGFTRDDDGNILATGIAEVEVAERYMDQGYTREDSQILAYFTAKQYEDTYAGDPIKVQLKNLCDAHKLGVIDNEALTGQASNILGSELLGSRFANKCNLDLRMGDIKTAIAAIRAMFLRGEADESDVTNMMIEAGVVAERHDSLLRLWRIQRAGKAKQVTAAKLCEWFGRRLIPESEVRVRLSRIGYKDADIDLMIANCKYGVLSREVKELEKLAKDQAKQEERVKKEAERQAKLRQSAEEKALRKLMKLDTEQNLKEWWKAGVIGPEQITEIFLLYGVNREDIERWLITYRPKPPSQSVSPPK